jgi:hypothetical protein
MSAQHFQNIKRKGTALMSSRGESWTGLATGLIDSEVSSGSQRRCG